MIKNKITFKASKLKDMFDKDILTWNESIQRCTGAWKPSQKSELIHSILTKDFYIPSLCFLRTIIPADEKTKKDVSVYSVIDGKQRLSVVFEFMNNEFKLHKSTPNLVIDGEAYELAGKKFKDLEEDLQKEISDYVFDIASIEECTEEEKELLFFRLNNGTSLTNVQKSRATMGSDVAGFINKLLDMNFFKMCSLTTLQRAREDSLTALLQGMMLLDETYEWTDLGAKEVAKYSVYLKDNCTILLQYKIVSTIKFLSSVFEEKDDFLRRINIPIIIWAAHECLKYENMEEDVFYSWYEEFTTNEEDKEFIKDREKYKDFCGEGSISKEKVNGRKKVIYDSMNRYLTFEENELCEESEEKRASYYAESGDVKFII